MMKRIFIGTLLMYSLWCAVAAFADCNGPVIDNANVLHGNMDVQNAAVALEAKGATVRVITDDADLTPEQYVGAMRKLCPSWQSADGGVKNNLIVFLAFPRHHKVGLFSGSEFGHALNASQIRSQFMAPAFRDGDFARGFIAGMNETGIQIEAFQSAPLHPASTVVTQQATDLRPMSNVLTLLVGLIGLAGLIALAFHLMRNRRARKAAQLDAVQARNEAAEAVNRHPDSPLADSFTRLAQSEVSNPDTDNLSTEDYQNIAARYRSITRNIVIDHAATSAKESSGPWNQPKKHHHRHSAAEYESSAPSPSPAPSTAATYQQTPTPQTVVVNNGNDGFFTGMIAGEMMGSRDREVIVERPDPDPERRDDRWSGSSSSSDSGSSSSWSDSSSSSSYDSGSSFSDSSSSSDFGSSGGDFSGGSSDF